MAPSDDNAVATAPAAEAKRLEDEARATLNQKLAAEEAANATLHTQPIAVINIKVLVPITLEKPANNYGRWRSLFLIVLGKYKLKPYVLSDDSYPDRSAWSTMDCCVLTWIYGTVSNDLQQSLMIREPGARMAWLYLKDESLRHSSLAPYCWRPSSAPSTGRPVHHALLPPP